MSISIECQGLPCPQPVIKCKKTIEQLNPENMTIVVDNEPANHNVSRFLQSNGYQTKSNLSKGIYTITASKQVSNSECEVCNVMTDKEIQILDEKIVVFIDSDKLGKGDDELGAKLMYNFISTLPELDTSLWRIVMVNGAVKLATQDNPCAELLKNIENSGVMVLVCGTCLDHFNLLDKKVCGETTNMLDVVTSLQLASKVIKA